MIIYTIPLHKRQCLVTILFTNPPSLHHLSFHEMILYTAPIYDTCMQVMAKSDYSCLTRGTSSWKWEWLSEFLSG